MEFILVSKQIAVSQDHGWEGANPTDPDLLTIWPSLPLYRKRLTVINFLINIID